MAEPIGGGAVVHAWGLNIFVPIAPMPDFTSRNAVMSLPKAEQPFGLTLRSRLMIVELRFLHP